MVDTVTMPLRAYSVFNRLDGSHMLKRDDGAFVPADPANGDYADYLARVAGGETFSVINEVAPPASRQLAPMAFRSLFTDAELLAIYTAANSSGPLAMWIGQLNCARYVDLNVDAPPALDVLVSAGLLTSARRTAILAG
jgi:hypothetical protein